jgi:hypothetical protein
LREHALAGARRADQQETVAASSGDEQRALRRGLTADIGNVEVAVPGNDGDLLAGFIATRVEGCAAHESADSEQRVRAARPTRLGEARLVQVRRWDHDIAAFARGMCRGEQHAFDWLELACQAQFAVELAGGQAMLGEFELL